MSVELIEQQESILQFDQFSNETGIEIGLKLMEMAKSEGKSIAIDITKNSQQVFHVSLDGTSVDNDEWLRRKRNTVLRFSCSTLRIQYHLKMINKTLFEVFHLDPQNYVDAGGGFPINVRGVGCIGSIVVTGTTEELEHELITTCLSKYLSKHDCPHL